MKVWNSGETFSLTGQLISWINSTKSLWSWEKILKIYFIEKQTSSIPIFFVCNTESFGMCYNRIHNNIPALKTGEWCAAHWMENLNWSLMNQTWVTFGDFWDFGGEMMRDFMLDVRCTYPVNFPCGFWVSLLRNKIITKGIQ